MPSKKRRSKGPSKAGFLITALVCAGAVAAVARYVKVAHADPPPKTTYTHQAEDSGTVAPLRGHRPTHHPVSNQERGGAFVYSPVWNGSQLSFTKEAVDVPDDQDPMVYAVNQYLQKTKIADPDATLLKVDLQNGVANLYFNGAMDKTYGTDDETTILNGILTTMGQFPEVKSVQFYAQGQKIETFGNADLSEAQPVMRDGAGSSTKQPEAPNP